MSLRKPATGVALTGGILAIGLASADGRIVVQYDATYSLPESRGFPCSGSGEAPVGETCPKAGDIATDDCRAYLLSFNGAVCVAPVDAQCVIVHDNVWGCAFPKTGYISAAEAETFRAYDGESSGWGSDESVQVIDEGFEEIFASANYDTTLDKPLGVNCDVATETMTQTTTGASKGFGLTNTGESTPDTHITEGGMTAGISTTGTSGKNTVDYGSTFTGTTGSAQTAGDYGSTTTGTTIIDFGTTGTTGTPDIYNTGRIDTMERGGTTLDNTVDTTDYTTGGSKTTGSYTKYGTTVLGLLNQDSDTTTDYTSGSKATVSNTIDTSETAEGGETTRGYSKHTSTTDYPASSGKTTGPYTTSANETMEDNEPTSHDFTGVKTTGSYTTDTETTGMVP
ncbi:hypothetical protein V7S43_002080 [Phytophthora oleae]|uniref:Cyst germination specific acidic repeat protein n=1 Tax=Phytophthora oleae TaxID=2107226 RepID=A0ABD3G457_9STRA